MRASIYRADHGALLAALCDEQALERYIAQLEGELPGCGDAALLRTMRQHLVQAALLMQEGLDHRAAIDRAAVDALLSDIFAVATWHGWPLPISRDDDQDLPLEPLPRGLLGADESVNSVLLFQLPDGRLALCRDRKADTIGDMTEHWQGERPPH